jgi:hypothetical protein
MKVSLVVKFAKGLVSFGLIFSLVTIINWHDIKELSPATAILVVLGSLNTFLVLLFMVWSWSLLINSQNGHAVALRTACCGYLIGSFYKMLTWSHWR